MRRRVLRATVLVLVVLAAAGCTRADAPPQTPPVAAAAHTQPARASVPAAAAPTPTDGPLFDLGRPPTTAEVRALDIDIAPDGRALPPGSGNAQEGAALFAAQCVRCHGANGERTQFGRLFGGGVPSGYKLGGVPRGATPVTVGNGYPHATTLFDYVRRSMPADAPGSLRSDQVYAVVAFLLWRNGIVDEKTRLDAASLPQVPMPARARFIEADASGR